MPAKKNGLYANIQRKRERIEHGSGEKMRQPGEKGAPAADAFRKAARTARKTKSPSGRKAKASTKSRASAKKK